MKLFIFLVPKKGFWYSKNTSRGFSYEIQTNKTLINLDCFICTRDEDEN